jgi:hypothetical protein
MSEYISIVMDVDTLDRAKTYNGTMSNWNELFTFIMDQLDCESAASTDFSYRLNGKNEY